MKPFVLLAEHPEAVLWCVLTVLIVTIVLVAIFGGHERIDGRSE